MGFFDWFGPYNAANSPRASVQSDGPGIVVSSPEELAEALRHGNMSSSGVAVTPDTALRVATVFGCIRLRSGPIANLPLNIKRRVDSRTREDASDHHVWNLMRRRPNKWQKPHQFKRMLQAHVLLRGNGYAYKVPGVGNRIQALIPLHPDRVKPKQLADWSMAYEWTRPDGTIRTLKQEEVLHLFGLTLDGITGVTPLSYARETIGLSLSMDRHVSKVMKNGARSAGSLSTKNSLSDKAYGHLKESLENFRSGGDQEGEVMILEEGLDYKSISLSPQDLQWIEARKLTRTEIAMYYGVPPHMLGDTEKSTSWGTGIEQQAQGYVTYTLQDDITMWEEGVTVDLISEPDIYAKFNLAGLIRGDFKTRTTGYASALQWGWLSPDDVREKEDMNPRTDGQGGQYYPPPNTAGGPIKTEEDDDDEQK